MQANSINNNISDTSADNANNFFDEMVSKLRYDEQLFINDIMPEKERTFYSKVMSGDIENITLQMRETTSQYFIANLLGTYLQDLLSSKKYPKKIAFELSDSNILVWAEIYNEDDTMENALILSQAKANAHFSKFGFHISTTIVDECDGLPVPSHYKTIPVTTH